MIRIGSIGLGGISTAVHIPGILRSPDLQLTAICDIDPARLAQRGDELGIPADHRFTDYRDLIHCPDVDVVDISTPNVFHKEMAICAARAGRSFGVEKPITMDTREAEELLAVTRKAGVRSMIYFSYRYKAAARFMRALVQSGRIGKIHHVNMQYYQAWGLAEAACKYVWRFDRSVAASGALGDLACHALDLVSFVTNASYESFSAHLDTIVHERDRLDGNGKGIVNVDDFSNILARMSGGLSASFQISRFAYGRGNYQRMEVYGEHGALVYHLDREPGKDELEICDASTGKKFVPLPIPDEYKCDQMQCFADLLNGKGDGLNATAEDGVMSERILDAILLAAKEKCWKDI